MAKKQTQQKSSEGVTVQIKAPNIKSATFKIVGTAPYVQLKFSQKAKEMMMDKMAAGSTARGKKQRTSRDFDDDYNHAMHISADGWRGIPASSFRNAMISACRLVGFKMTIAKMAVFIQADGFDATEGTPMVKITGEPFRLDMAVRNATGVADIRVRAMWKKWSAAIRVEYDADQFTIEDVTNLMARVGKQVGIGEGRHDSKSSAGMGWGTFSIA